MGIPSELRDMWIANKNTSLLIASPAEEQKMLRSSQCTAGNYYFSYNILQASFNFLIHQCMFQAYDLLHKHVNLFSKIFINQVIGDRYSVDKIANLFFSIDYMNSQYFLIYMNFTVCHFLNMQKVCVLDSRQPASDVWRVPCLLYVSF
jgi:hypothetical protein